MFLNKIFLSLCCLEFVEVLRHIDSCLSSDLESFQSLFLYIFSLSFSLFTSGSAMMFTLVCLMVSNRSLKFCSLYSFFPFPFKKNYWSIVDLCFVLVAAVQRIESVKHIHISTLFFRFFFLWIIRVLSRVSCALNRFLLNIYFIYSTIYLSIPISQFIPPALPPLGNHKLVFYICDSISVL